MKKLLIFMIFGILLFINFACNPSDSEANEQEIYENTGSGCGTHNGHTLYRGPEGGCYYYNSNGNKTYVDRSECRC